MIRIVVDRQRVLLAIQREFTLGDPIANSAGGATGAGIRFRFITGKIIETQNDIIHFAASIGHVEFHQSCAAGHHFDGHARVVVQRIEFDSGAILSLAEISCLGRSCDQSRRVQTTRYCSESEKSHFFESRYKQPRRKHASGIIVSEETLRGAQGRPEERRGSKP